MDTVTAEETPEEQALDKSCRQIIHSKRTLQTEFQQDEWLCPDSSCHSLPAPPGPVCTQTPFTSNPEQNKLKTFPAQEYPKPCYLPISPCISLPLSPTNPAPHQLPGWAGEIPSPMAQSFHLSAQFCSLFSSAFHVFSFFFSTLFRELRAWSS